MKRISLKTAMGSQKPYAVATEVYSNNNLILNRGTLLTKDVISSLYKLGIMSVLVREPGEEPAEDAGSAVQNTAAVSAEGDKDAKTAQDEAIDRMLSKPLDFKPTPAESKALETFTFSKKYREVFNAGINALAHGDLDSVVDVSKKLADTISSSSSILEELEAMRQGCDTVFSHSMNVSVMAIAVGLMIGMGTKAVELLGAAAMMHDVGKMYIDKSILNKPAKLTKDEYAVVKGHSGIGSRKLALNKALDPKIVAVALQHHENNDGTGYPKGAKSDDILLESRIVHVCDVYEALIAERCYKDSMLPGLAMEYIMSKCGTMFDKDVLEAFVHTVPAYKSGDKIILSDGEKATVLHGTQKNSLRPVIRIDMSGKVVDLFEDKAFLSYTITGIGESIYKETMVRT